MNISIELTEKQHHALVKRVTANATPEELAATVVAETAQNWAEQDYQVLSAELVSKLKDQPQSVLDSVVEQLSKLP